MNRPMDAAEASAPLPRLTLLALLEAAHGLRLAGALPAPPGMSGHRMSAAGVMRPWLRLALGEEAVAALERSHKGSWWTGALLGHDVGPRPAPSLAFDPSELHGLLALDALCSDANGQRRSAWFGIRNRIPDAVARKMFPSMDQDDLDGVVDFSPLLDGLEGLLDEMAAYHGLTPRKTPADLSAWGERTMDGVAGIRIPRRYYPGSSHAMEWEQLPVRMEDGSETVLNEADPVLWPGLHGPDYGKRLRLTWKGVTAGHPGYLARVENVDDIEFRDRLRRDREFEAGMEAFRAAAARGAVDGNGRKLAEKDAVELLTDCKEASRGTRGTVVEILGDMAMVDFGRRGVRKVPCYGHALKHAD